MIIKIVMIIIVNIINIINFKPTLPKRDVRPPTGHQCPPARVRPLKRENCVEIIGKYSFCVSKATLLLVGYFFSFCFSSVKTATFLFHHIAFQSMFLPYFPSMFLFSSRSKLTLLLFQIMFVPNVPPVPLYRCLNRRPKELSLYAYEQSYGQCHDKDNNYDDYADDRNFDEKSF